MKFGKKQKNQRNEIHNSKSESSAQKCRAGTTRILRTVFECSRLFLCTNIRLGAFSAKHWRAFRHVYDLAGSSRVLRRRNISLLASMSIRMEIRLYDLPIGSRFNTVNFDSLNYLEKQIFYSYTRTLTIEHFTKLFAPE
jgi:hypothetical protein